MARTYREFNGRKVTENQWYVLDALQRHGRYDTQGGSGWVWQNGSTTVRILEALARKGLVLITEKRSPRTGDGYTEYHLAES